MEKFLKKLAVRSFDSNLFKNKAGIYLAVIVTHSYFEILIFENGPQFFWDFHKYTHAEIGNLSIHIMWLRDKILWLKYN